MFTHKKSEAIKILYKKYLEFRGQDPYKVCRALSVKISYHDYIIKGNGWLFRTSNNDGKKYFHMRLPYLKISTEYEHLVIFHELAHSFIFDLRPSGWNIPPDPLEEAFCDNFSLAMILARYNYTPTNIHDYENFFQRGVGLKRLEESDPYLGRKILSSLINPEQLNLSFEQEPIINGIHPLIDLAHILIKQT